MIRRFFLPVVTVITSIVFVGKLISLQLLNSSYKLLSDGNAVIENSIYPERGYIYDRNLKLLVSNQPVYDLMAIPENISSFDTLELSKLLGVSKAELTEKIKSARTFSTNSWSGPSHVPNTVSCSAVAVDEIKASVAVLAKKANFILSSLR